MSGVQLYPFTLLLLHGLLYQPQTQLERVLHWKTWSKSLRFQHPTWFFFLTQMVLNKAKYNFVFYLFLDQKTYIKKKSNDRRTMSFVTLLGVNTKIILVNVAKVSYIFSNIYINLKF